MGDATRAESRFLHGGHKKCAALSVVLYPFHQNTIATIVHRRWKTGTVTRQETYSGGRPGSGSGTNSEKRLRRKKAVPRKNLNPSSERRGVTSG